MKPELIIENAFLNKCYFTVTVAAGPCQDHRVQATAPVGQHTGGDASQVAGDHPLVLKGHRPQGAGPGHLHRGGGEDKGGGGQEHVAVQDPADQGFRQVNLF